MNKCTLRIDKRLQMVNSILKLFLLLAFVIISINVFGQNVSKHIVKIGIAPYTHFFNENLSGFNIGGVSLLPTFEYNYRMKKLDLVFRRNVVDIALRGNVVRMDTVFLLSRQLKAITIGVQKTIPLHRRFQILLGSGINFTFGEDGVASISGNNYALDGFRFEGFGLEFFTRLKYYIAPSISIEPALNLHLNYHRTLHSATFIVLFGFDF